MHVIAGGARDSEELKCLDQSCGLDCCRVCAAVPPTSTLQSTRSWAAGMLTGQDAAMTCDKNVLVHPGQHWYCVQHKIAQLAGQAVSALVQGTTQ